MCVMIFLCNDFFFFLKLIRLYQKINSIYAKNDKCGSSRNFIAFNILFFEFYKNAFSVFKYRNYGLLFVLIKFIIICFLGKIFVNHYLGWFSFFKTKMKQKMCWMFAKHDNYNKYERKSSIGFLYPARPRKNSFTLCFVFNIRKIE